jgi:hypothetical protein
MAFNRKGSKLPPPHAQPIVPLLASRDDDPPRPSAAAGRAPEARLRMAPPMTGPFCIDKGVPVAAKFYGGRVSRFPFSQLEVGDSFFVPGRKYMTTPMSVSDRTFVKRRITENGVPGMRVWRTK